MSTMIMSKCWPLVMPPTAKAVLISLADNANDHGHCWPSIPTICRRTCYGKTAVIEALRWLEERRFVMADRSTGRSNSYWIDPNPSLELPLDPSGRRTSPAGGPLRQTDSPFRQANHHPSGRRTGPVRQTDPNRQEPSFEPSLNRQSCASRSRALLTNEARVVDVAKGTRLPPYWEPDANDQAFAELHLGPNWREQLEAFRDYWEGVPGAKGRKVKWGATFRNWVRKERSDQRKRRAQTERPSATLQAITTLLKG